MENIIDKISFLFLFLLVRLYSKGNIMLTEQRQLIISSGNSLPPPSTPSCCPPTSHSRTGEDPTPTPLHFSFLFWYALSLPKRILGHTRTHCFAYGLMTIEISTSVSWDMEPWNHLTLPPLLFQVLASNSTACCIMSLWYVMFCSRDGAFPVHIMSTTSLPHLWINKKDEPK